MVMCSAPARVAIAAVAVAIAAAGCSRGPSTTVSAQAGATHGIPSFTATLVETAMDGAQTIWRLDFEGPESWELSQTALLGPDGRSQPFALPDLVRSQRSGRYRQLNKDVYDLTGIPADVKAAHQDQYMAMDPEARRAFLDDLVAEGVIPPPRDYVSIDEAAVEPRSPSPLFDVVAPFNAAFRQARREDVAGGARVVITTDESCEAFPEAACTTPTVTVSRTFQLRPDGIPKALTVTAGGTVVARSELRDVEIRP